MYRKYIYNIYLQLNSVILYEYVNMYNLLINNFNSLYDIYVLTNLYENDINYIKKKIYQNSINYKYVLFHYEIEKLLRSKGIYPFNVRI